MPKNKNTKRLKTYWIILICLILPGFIIWGSEVTLQYFSSKNYVGVVFGKKVTQDEFINALNALRHQIILATGEDPLKEASSFDISSQVWDRIILLKEAKRKKIKVSDEEIINFIQKQSLFKQNNRFNFNLYRRVIWELFKIDTRTFEEEIRQNLLLYKLYNEITQDIKLTEDEIRLAYLRENEMLSIDYLEILLKDLENNISYNDESLLSYYSENRQNFRKPTTFNLQYIEEKDPKRIEKLYKNLRKKKTTKILKDLGYKINETGFFSLDQPIPGIEWSLALPVWIEKLKVGEFSPPLKIKDSYFVFYLKERKETYIPSFEEIKEKIKEEFIKSETKKLAKQILSQAMQEIKQLKPEEIDFLTIAQKYNIKNGTTDLFKRNSYIPQLGSSDRFFMAFKEFKEGKIAEEIIETEQAMFIVRIKNYVGIDEKKYQEEKDKFSKDLLLKVKEMYFSRFLWQLRDKASIKTSF